jgi:hypothetical protein
MEPEGSLPCSQEPSTGPYSQLIRSSPYQPILSNVLFFLVVSFFLAFPPISYMNSSSPIRATCPTQPTLLDFIFLIMFSEVYKLWSSILCSFLQSPVTSYLFGPNIFLSTLFSNTLSLCFSLNVRDQVSHPYSTTAKIIVLYILIFMFLDRL